VTGQKCLDRRDGEHIVAEYDANQKIPVRNAFNAFVPISPVSGVLLKFSEMSVSISKSGSYLLNDVACFHIPILFYA